ncbi:MAG: NUDIX hydrolase [Thermodesulfobacteriota bacterium]|nr:NUDIX hydrolase [Thermodesulfobacteriota bacterium]
MQRKKFCHFCGHRLEQKIWEGRERPFCLQCKVPIYENPVPATAVVVTDSRNGLLLVKRKVNPKKGYWSLPGGFMELGETPESCALRELHEETGLTGTIDLLLGVASNKSDAYDTVLIVGYLVNHYTGDLQPGDDAEDVAFFPLDGLPEIAFTSHRQFIDTALRLISS